MTPRSFAKMSESRRSHTVQMWTVLGLLLEKHGRLINKTHRAGHHGTVQKLALPNVWSNLSNAPSNTTLSSRHDCAATSCSVEHQVPKAPASWPLVAGSDGPSAGRILETWRQGILCFQIPNGSVEKRIKHRAKQKTSGDLR